MLQVVKVHCRLIVNTTTTRTEVMKFVWISGAEGCSKMIPEVILDTSSVDKLVSIIGKEFHQS